jgi:uncharacterized paraquat-inducible protein A
VTVFQRGIDGSEPIRPGRSESQEEHRVARTARLGTGTLACPECDAPVALAPGPASPAALLECPYCGHTAALREFLSLAQPARPAWVEVRVVEK